MFSYQKIDCSLILTDLSGFTQLLYHASCKEEIMKRVIGGIQRMFQNASKAATVAKDVQIINTTGDGFLAMVTGETPSRTAVAYAKMLEKQFASHLKSILHNVPFRQRVDLRIALHHGCVYRVEITDVSKEGYPIFIGDDINLLARVINSQTARRFVVAVTRAFYKRLVLGKETDLPIPDEVIVDRNRYPEQIEIYRLPEVIRAYTPRRKRTAT
jgi:class 3 adenylate cyclase